MATATTSRPVSLPTQLIATDVSKPPEYARMTRSDIFISSSPDSLQLLEPGSQFGAGHRVASNHQYRVVAGDGAHDVGKGRAIDRQRQIVRGARWGAQH